MISSNFTLVTFGGRKMTQTAIKEVPEVVKFKSFQEVLDERNKQIDERLQEFTKRSEDRKKRIEKMLNR